jgi:small subunit ribosomal protein S16
MVKIRLARAGAKKRPFYHVVATDSRSPRDSKFIERLGHYDPLTTKAGEKWVVDAARLEHWKKTGAIFSERVEFLIRQAAGKGEAAKAAG